MEFLIGFIAILVIVLIIRIMISTSQKEKDQINISLEIPSKRTYHDYFIYKFISNTSDFYLKPMLEQHDLSKFWKENHINELKKRLKTKDYQNPLNFDDFGTKFDYISIDFETAGRERLSVCAIGLSFFKNNKCIDKRFEYINPPINNFESRNISLHGIKPEDVEYMDTFIELWEHQLKKYFKTNLLVLHNSSMDASILKQLFAHYDITDKLKYVDTMQVAKKNDLPTKLQDLCKHYNIPFDNIHDAAEDAFVCGVLYSNLIDEIQNIDKYQKFIFAEKNIENNIHENNFYRSKVHDNLSTDSINSLENIVKKYSVNRSDIDSIELKEVRIVITGKFDEISRSDIKSELLMLGAKVTTTVSGLTKYVVLGSEYGPSKIEKIDDLNTNKNKNIKILKESDILYLIGKN